MPQKVYLWILKLGVIASFICTVFVFRSMLFPYITSKQIPFNIWLEILFVFWLAFIIKYPQWSPFRGFSKSWPLKLFFGKKKAEISAEAQEQKNSPLGRGASAAEAGWVRPGDGRKTDRRNRRDEAPVEVPPPAAPRNLITLGLFVFFIMITISCFTGVDFHMSFWSNAERMLGVFHILHFLMLYLIAITVMRDWKDWLMTLLVLLGFCLYIALVGIGMNNNYSLLGNSLYASIFAIFAAYFVFIIFFHQDPRSEKKGITSWKWLLFLALPLLYIMFKRADNTGDYVGVAAGVAAFIFLLGIINKRRLVRIASWAVTILIIAAFIFVFTEQHNPFIAGNHVLGQMDFAKNTFQTRLLSWRSAVKDFPNHWLLGTGFGNYAITFDKYFDAKFFTYTMGETYFDRAHNNIIDIASTTGVLGIGSYLAIWAVIGIYLIGLLRRKRISPLEFCVFSSLLTAYFVQNLTVFDSFVSYMCFMIVLGYLNWLSNTDEDRGNERALLAAGGPAGFADKEIYALLGAGILAVLLIYNFSILPLNTFSKVIDGQMAFGQGDIKTAVALYKEALGNKAPLKRDSRSMFLRAIADAGWTIAKMDQASVNDIVSFAASEGEKNLSDNPHDSLMNMELARVYDVGFRAVTDKNKKAEYGQKALEYIDRSIAASPQRVPVYFIKAQFLIGQNRVDEAVSTLEQAAGISDVFAETYCQLGQIYLIKENNFASQHATSSAKEMADKGWAKMDVCLDRGAANSLAVEDVVKEAIDHYIDKKDITKVIALYHQLVSFEPNNAQYWVTLARLYQGQGDNTNAIGAAQQAATIDPSLKADADQFIKQMENSQ